MKIAITDACIFIDIYDLQLTSKFFGLELDIHTSVDVFNELYDEQKEMLRAYQSVGKLTLHSILEEDRKVMFTKGYPKSLSDNDKTVLYLSEKIDAMVLSSDKAVRNHAKKLCVEYHGMLWVLDKLIETNLIDKSTAIEKINQLFKTNIIYQNNLELKVEIDKRLGIWSSN
jgi:predicted nucleic acid-binding protein